MSSKTAQVMRAVVEVGTYEHHEYMCSALLGIYNSIQMVEKEPHMRAMFAAGKVMDKGLTSNDVRCAMNDLTNYMFELSGAPHDHLIGLLRGKVGNKFDDCRPTVDALSPLYLDWDNRPQTKAELKTYWETHCVKHY